jgi:hypothetical protein
MNTTSRLAVNIAMGMDERVPPVPDSVELLQNMTFEARTRGWDSRIGYENYFPIVNVRYPLSDSAYTLNFRVDSVYIWSKLHGRQRFLIADGYDATSGLNQLLLVRPNTGTLAGNPNVYRLDADRAPTGLNDYATQYVPFGPYLVILNGPNRPLKIFGWPFDFATTSGESPSLPIGFQWLPTPPTAWAVSDSLTAIEPGTNVRMAVSASSGEGGLGATDKGRYLWKVSFVSDSGSESPLSADSNDIEWSGVSTRQVCMLEIPRGPKGTVARRIYRTKNMSDGFLSDFYYIGQIDNNIETNFFDHVPDTSLGTLAPEGTSSVIFPAQGARFGASYAGCLFLEGGVNTGPKVFWSKPGLPDQYGLLDFLDFGTSAGGSLTALHAYYNALLVFREGSVEVITGSYGAFSTGTLVQGVGCVGPNGVLELPGVGVMFIAHDGIYLLTGGLDGGSQVQVNKMSEPLSETWKKVNRPLLSRAVCAYSPKWREAHFYVPTQGEDRPNLGLVFHMDKQCWSLRSGFPVGSLTTTPEGDFVFGHNKGQLTNAADESGIFVISRCRAQGYAARADGNAAILSNVAPMSKFNSPALDFGAGEVKKFVKYVYLHALTLGGDNEITLTYVLDDAYTGTVTESRQMQRPDSADQEVIGTALYGSGSWEKGLVTDIRFPIPEKGCSRFQFQLSTRQDIVLVGYTIEYSITGTRVITGQSVAATRSRA